jgi:hypothetical protein
MAELGRRDADLEALRALAARVEALERAWLAGDADAVLVFAETCARIRRVPGTVSRWYSRRETRERYRLEALFTRDATGHLVSSPRRLMAWQREMAAKFTAPSALTRRPIQKAKGPASTGPTGANRREQHTAT